MYINGVRNVECSIQPPQDDLTLTIVRDATRADQCHRPVCIKVNLEIIIFNHPCLYLFRGTNTGSSCPVYTSVIQYISGKQTQPSPLQSLALIT